MTETEAQRRISRNRRLARDLKRSATVAGFARLAMIGIIFRLLAENT